MPRLWNESNGEDNRVGRIPEVLLWIPIAFLLGCSGPQKEREIPSGQASPPAPAPARPTPDPRPLIVAFGNSLTAGYGVLPEESYPARLQSIIDAAGYPYRVVNAGVSGDTSSQGVNRLQAIIDLRPAIVIVELGANDGLRGLPVAATRVNLESIIGGLQQAGAVAIVAGMEMPPNYGPLYTDAFRRIFPETATKYDVPLIPFFLEGVGGHPELNQADGIHPTGEGYRTVTENIWRIIEPVLKQLQRGAVAASVR